MGLSGLSDWHADVTNKFSFRPIPSRKSQNLQGGGHFDVPEIGSQFPSIGSSYELITGSSNDMFK